MAGENRFEEHALDVVARGLASNTMSRRRALKIVAAAGVGALLSVMGARDVAAAPPKCRQEGQSCNERLQCCPTTIGGIEYKLECSPLNLREPGQEERGIKVCWNVGPV